MKGLMEQLVQDIKDRIPKWNIVFIVIDYDYKGFVRVFDNRAAARSYYNEITQYSSRVILLERHIETECEPVKWN